MESALSSKSQQPAARAIWGPFQLSRNIPKGQSILSTTDFATYYSDKDLDWWLNFARTFKAAVNTPLPDEDEE